MSGALNSLLDRFRDRQRVRHAMFAHMGIDIAEERAARHFDNLRASMLACNRCRCTDPCEKWISDGYEGAPDFCRARSALRALQRASDRYHPTRHAAE